MRIYNSARSKGFTLIELLIVVAIIAILAAIAVPNFLEAQTRSKVSRNYADFASLATAMEAFNIDNDRYIYDYGVSEHATWMQLVTPIAYINQVFNSPWLGDYGQPTESTDNPQGLRYYGYAVGYGRVKYFVNSYGPDQNQNIIWTTAFIDSIDLGDAPGIDSVYDATNGTVSRGDIIRSDKRIYYK